MEFEPKNQQATENNPSPTPESQQGAAPTNDEPSNPNDPNLAPALTPLGAKSEQPFYKRNPLTVGFSVLLALIYALTTQSADFKGPPDLIVMLGGFYPPAVHAGEWWRFITATLLHGNPGHLFNNAVGLLIFGNLLEPVIGSWRLAALYVISALAGLGLSYFMLPEGMTYGASTIDYGLIGAYLTLVLILRYRYNREAFFREFRGALIFVLLFVGWNTLESTTVNLWGHLGGLIGGVGFALWVGLRRKKIQA